MLWAALALTGSTEPAALLSRAAALRADIRTVTNAYRLVDDAADGFPNITVDCYADWAVVSLYDARDESREHSALIPRSSWR